jgi:hypothetical protein
MNNHEKSPVSIPGARGFVRDFNRLTNDGGASVAELRQFIGQMRGRSPQEVLGLVAQSSLLHGVIVATLLTVLLMATFTVGPYFWNKATQIVKQPAPAPVAKTTEAAPAAEKPTASAEVSPPKADRAEPLEKPQIDPALAKRLGVDEVKGSDPNKNPLDSKDDDLLNIK